MNMPDLTPNALVSLALRLVDYGWRTVDSVAGTLVTLEKIGKWLDTDDLGEVLRFIEEPRFCAHCDNLSVSDMAVSLWPTNRPVLWDKAGPMPAEFTDAIIQRAYDTWSAECPLRFAKASPGNPGEIVKTSGRIDGRGGTLAYSGLGRGSGGKTEQKYDTSEDWPRIVLAVLIHEIGHALGLGHSNDPDSIMFPTLKVRDTLAPSDIAAIQRLYGKPTTPKPLPTPPQIPLPGNAVELVWKDTGGISDNRLSVQNAREMRLFVNGKQAIVSVPQ